MVENVGPRTTWDGALLRREHHAAALSAAAQRALAAGAFEAAFRLADRRCRLPIVARAWDFLLRSLAHRALGRADAAEHDLERALGCDASDPLVNRILLEHGTSAASRLAAARNLLANPRASDASMRAALRHIGREDRTIALDATRNGDTLEGWVAWSGANSVDLLVRTEATADRFVIGPDPQHRLAAALGNASAFSLPSPASLPLALEARAGAAVAPVTNLYAQALAHSEDRDRGAVRRKPAVRPAVTVIVPVYGDLAATRACLDALRAQRTSRPLRVVLVDDATPDPDIAALADRFRAETGADLIRNRVNHGFAGSVNKALALCREGDVLLLNADALLPEDAVERFAAVARADPAIGTVLPFSNDSEFTSFPRPNVPNRLPDAARAAEIDAAACAANGSGCVDLVNGIGFCLYVTRACLDAIGPLSLAYGRGYYEDVELCLRAREAGFRNVAATGLYVRHASGRSFGTEKRGWVTRNYPVLEARFPTYTLECATFLEADPLRAARVAIERRLPPQEPVCLVVGRPERLGPALPRRCLDLARAEVVALVVSWRRTAGGGEVLIRASGDAPPQSLAFGPSSAEGTALLGYLRALDLLWVELGERAALPSALQAALARLAAPIYGLAADRDACDAATETTVPPPHGRVPPDLVPGTRVIAADRMARARCDALRGPAPRTRGPRSFARRHSREGAMRLAVLAPLVGPAVDRLLLRLVPAAAWAGVSVVVLGQTLDDIRLMGSGALAVTGAIEPEDAPAALAAYEATAVLSPYRDRLFGAADDLAGGTGLPKAYFDWSGGGLERAPGDLALDPRLDDPAAATALVDWCTA